jgi:predicted ATPase
MAHIVEFKITGLAGRKNVIHEKLHRHVNVFFGLNGSGKTSLLKILDSAMEGDARLLTSVPFESAEVVIHSLELNQDFCRKIHRKELKKTIQDQEKLIKKDHIKYADVIYDIKYSPNSEGQQWGWTSSIPSNSSSKYQHIFLPTHRILTGFEPYSFITNRNALGAGESSIDWEQYFAKNLEHHWLNYSNKSLSQIQKIQQNGLANILKGFLSADVLSKSKKTKINSEDNLIYNRVAAFLNRQELPKIITNKEQFQNRYRTDKMFRQIVSDIDEVERKIEATITTRNKLQLLINEMFSGNKSVVFSDANIDVKTNDNQKIGLHSLSSGEKQAILIFIETLLITESALLIDEPEISMHVDWQKNLISSMRLLNPNAQFIFATHSPEIMADVPNENIFKL